MKKHAVVTGGGSGIGAAVAKRLLADGFRVTLMGRSEDRLRSSQAALGDVAIQICDVGNEDSVTDAFAAVGEVDILVNNAGQVETAPLARTSLELWQRLLNVNLTGSFLCSRAVLPGMLLRKEGRIINVASTAALKGYAYVAAYCAAKHGVLGLTRAMALEVAAKGVTVNAVCPGYTETDIVANAVDTIVAKTGRTAEQARTELAKVNPQGRLIQPEEVADTVAWIVGNSAINGQAIAVCGGETM
ncbi:SDR family NAD(P)-dependent oxidoreductase [Pelomonas sp. Root1237]|uniref:SDR family NAD(P)-dependent oxidoreductase n=1 Tax=Pelomonas sp. Root1237 TaxID=1736434 RepID=UPI0006F55D63|nr:SDR family oxidoreductase [Pelomonas sp. Root1237]KQV94782.1 3-hydroxyacyl-CoA dehydrogenase [Pelomonas sp. Root1237]